MPTNTNILGLGCALYRNNGTIGSGSPSWVENTNVKDLELQLETDIADLTVRANNGWRAELGTLKKGTITFQSVWDPADANFLAFFNAFLSNSLIEVAALNGKIENNGSHGLRMVATVTKCARTEKLTEGVMADITISPAYHAQAPAWVVASGGNLTTP